MRKILVLASGGLDSTVVLALYKNLGYDVHLLYLPHGNLNEDAELKRMMAVVGKLEIPEEHTYVHEINLRYSNSSCIKEDGGHPYVEGRNLLFISYALSIAETKGIDEVAIGFIQDPEDGGYSDTNQQFLYNINAVSLSSSGIPVRAPLMELDKAGVYRLGKKLGISLEDTISCYKPENGSKPCGVCFDCQDIKKLIKECDIPDSDNPFKTK